VVEQSGDSAAPQGIAMSAGGRSPSGWAASGWPSSATMGGFGRAVRVFSDDGRCVADPLDAPGAEYVKALTA